MITKTSTHIYCGMCRRDTNHHVLHTFTKKSDFHDQSLWQETHYFAQCAGCDAHCYAIATDTEDTWNSYTGEMESIWKIFPAPFEGRRLMENNHLLPSSVTAIYREVIEAINIKLSLLAAMGLRALIEAICNECHIAKSSLNKRIDELAAEGVLSTNQATTLHTLRFLGNHAAHEITKAQPGEILAALEIAESMLKSIYVVPHLANQVSTGQPEEDQV